MAAAIVGGRKNCEELAAGEAFEPVHHTLVSTENIL